MMLKDLNTIILAHRICMWKALEGVIAVCGELQAEAAQADAHFDFDVAGARAAVTLFLREQAADGIRELDEHIGGYGVPLRSAN